MVFTRKQSRAVANPESPPRIQIVTNISEVCTPIWTVFTREQNELLIQQVFQYSREVKGYELHHLVLGLNESSTEVDMKKAYYSLAL